MSKIHTDHVFTSESVSEGHPDKVCDQISDAILDACLMQDPDSRVACETLTTTNLVVISGEITTKAKINWQEIALDAVRKIGYNDPNVGFCADEAKVMVCVHKQSPDISQGVTEGQGMFTEQGAGDQGMMFGYASNETPALMPAPIYYAHKIVEELARLRHTEPEKYRYLRPDSKSQVSIRYSQGKPVAVTAVVVSHQHTPDMEHSWLEALVKEVVRKVVPAELLNDDIVYYVNPTGRFEIGGPHGDTGLTGRKIIVDTYGGMGRHGGGAFSGKDCTKVDRSAAYAARWVAKNVVAAGLAARCEVQVAYAIGMAKPVSVMIDTFGTNAVPEADIMAAVDATFDLRPGAIIDALDLRRPIYRLTAAYGHFGRELPEFTWERTDKADELRKACGLA